MKRIVTTVLLVLSLPVMATTVHHRDHHDSNPHSHAPQQQPLQLAATIYYVWCVDEEKRIGGYTGDNKVANNRAKNHSWNTGHNTRVDIK